MRGFLWAVVALTGFTDYTTKLLQLFGLLSTKKTKQKEKLTWLKEMDDIREGYINQMITWVKVTAVQ